MTEKDTNYSTFDETIDEIEDFIDSPSDYEMFEDKEEIDPIDDSTSDEEDDDVLSSYDSEDNEDDLENLEAPEDAEYFLGTFKTKEDADKGFKEAQSKITSQANRIKELENVLKNATSSDETGRKIAHIQQQAELMYAAQVENLRNRCNAAISAVRSSTANPQAMYQTEQQILSNFIQEAQKASEILNSKLSQEVQNIYAAAQKAEEELIARDRLRYPNNKTGEMIVNAWHRPPNSIEGVAELFSTYKALVIDDFLKEQAARSEDSAHKSKLTTNALSNGRPKYGNNHIFTIKELSTMSDEDFAKYEKIIEKQVAQRLVK